MKQFYIYLTTNLIDGKQYIGQHRGDENDAYLGSGKIIKKAIEKYGKENFKKIILEFCKEEELDEKEKYWIKYYNAYEDENFYNLSEGGQGGDGWRLTNKWFKEHPEEAQKIYQENGKRLQQWVKEHPQEAKENIKKMIEGRKKWVEENPNRVKEIMEKVNEGKEKWQKEHPKEHQEQIQKWVLAGSKANSKKVKCITTDKVFNSVSEAARYYGIPQGNISKVLKGERQSCGKLSDGTKLKWEWV